MIKRLIAVLLALMCCVTLMAGCGGNGDEQSGGKQNNPALDNYEAPDLTGVTINLFTTNNADMDYEGCWVDGQIEKKLGVSVNFNELDSWNEQYLTMMSEGNPPDLTFGNTYQDIYFQFGDEGAYVNLKNYLDVMPNLKAYIEDPEHVALVERFTSEDGALYFLPAYVEAKHDPYVFLYRKDIFDANALTFPTNQDEFVATLRKLKEIYPDSYPFVIRNMTGNMHTIQSMGHLWGASHVNVGIANTIFTQDANGNFFSAQTGDAYTEMAKFLQSLTQEGLMHPSCATMDNATWQEALASGASFITFDKADRIPQLTKVGRSLKEDYELAAGAPFNFGTYAETAETVTTSFAIGIDGGDSMWFAIGNNKNKENTMAYLDWICSQEGQLMTNWGIEGESYTVDENGNKQFIRSFLDAQGGLQAAGLYIPGIGCTRMLEALKASQTEEEAAYLAMGLEYVEKAAPQHLLHYNEEEQLLWDTYATALYNYENEQWLKFFLGKIDDSQWESISETMKSKYHYDDLMKIHKDALARLLEEKG